MRVTPGALGEWLDGRRQGEEVSLAPLWAPLGYLEHSPEPPRARKFTGEQAQGGARRRVGAVPRAFRA